MIGVSLGHRTGSYGSLPQQVQNGGFSIRKASRASLSGSREKERYLPSLFRYFGRTKVNMLILVVSAVFLLVTGFFIVNKEDASESSGLGFDARILGETSTSNSFKHNTVTTCAENKSQLPPLNHSSAAAVAIGSPIITSHPCKNFAFPPPPPGERRLSGHRPCPVCYVPVEQAIASMPRFPSASPGVSHLTYFQEDNPTKTETYGGSDFGGYPSLKQRNDSFNIEESMTLHCGFVKGCRAGDHTGFDIDVADLSEMDECHDVIVASAIFGNYDIIQQPTNISETARKNIPFYMFVDEETEAYMKNSSILDSSKRVGLWRIIVVHNVPYADPRRNGKVPKLLLHRLFPNTRYSIWVDGKLKLVVDPYQILERFLWSQNATFAISRHYSRFDVFAEAEANKRAHKYDNLSIDEQIMFYILEGLTPYSEAKLPITSDVPEGCVIIKEHIPITNLFTCLWFNEVDRFTSRDQLSFSTVRDRVMRKVDWTINMFQDCERRNFVIQRYHREDMLKHRPPPPPPPPRYSPPSFIRDKLVTKTPEKKGPSKRGRGDRKSGSRRHHRKFIAGSRENTSI